MPSKEFHEQQQLLKSGKGEGAGGIAFLSLNCVHGEDLVWGLENLYTDQPRNL